MSAATEVQDLRHLWQYRLLNPGLIAGDCGGEVYVEVSYDNRLNPTHPCTLSLSGVIGPKANGDAKGSCGQIGDYLADVWAYHDGWSPEMVARLAELWDTWHLNGMRAGTPAQTAWLKEHRDEFPGYPVSHYTWACEQLAAVGLNPDSTHNDYRYGSAWLTVEVPADILAELFNMPESERPLPGSWAHR